MSNPDLMAYHDGELSPARRSEVEQHLKTCAQCRMQLDEWQSLDQMVRAEGPTAQAPQLRLRDPGPWRPWLRAAILILGLSLAWVLRPRPEPPPEGGVDGTQRYEVRHGAQSYKLETSGGTLLMVDLEDEQGRAQARIGGDE